MSRQVASAQPIAATLTGIVEDRSPRGPTTPPVTTAREEREHMPLPTEPRTIFLGGMFLLASLAALYVASPIVLPVVLAIVLKLLLQPLVRLTDRAGCRAPSARCWRSFCWWRRSPAWSAASRDRRRPGPASCRTRIPQIQHQLAFLARPIASHGMDDGPTAERHRRRRQPCRRRRRCTRRST